MKSACVSVLSIIELKNARWNIEKSKNNVVFDGVKTNFDSVEKKLSIKNLIVLPAFPIT